MLTRLLQCLVVHILHVVLCLIICAHFCFETARAPCEKTVHVYVVFSYGFPLFVFGFQCVARDVATPMCFPRDTRFVLGGVHVVCTWCCDGDA